MSTTTRDEILAGEQRAVDHAYDCYAAKLAELSGTSAATASASGKDGIANRAEAEARAAAYGGLGDEALVFARVDAPEDPGGEARPWYIGRRSVHDTSHELVVLPWTSPLAKTWIEARPEDPGEVVLRRQLRCVRQVVESYFDEISSSASVPAPLVVSEPEPELAAVPEPRKAADDSVAEETEAPQVPERMPAPTPGDVVRQQRRKVLQPDEFLLRELQRSRGGRMRDIVETIRRDQMELVTGSPSDILVVQGGPGTGKSAVGLHRVTWLVNNEHFKAQDILVIGPHQRFLDYVGQVLPTLGTRDVNAVQLDRLWEGEILGTDSPKARLVKSDDRMAAVLRRRVESDYRPEALDALTVAPSFEGDEPAIVVTAGSTTLRVPKSEVLALLDRAHAGDGPFRERRDRFRGLFVDRLLQELADIAPRRGQAGTIRRDLERNRRVERLVERVWPSPGPREALRSLYDSADLLRDCADGILDEDERTALLRARAASADADPWTLDDHVCLEELRVLISGDTPPRYGHIVVDEAQDLTPMQARSLRRRCAVGGSMTVLGDLAQATGAHIPTSWDLLGALLSDHGDWSVAQLTTSYRVPAEIMEFVAPLAQVIASSLPYPRAVREAGADAVRTVATEPWKLLDDTVDQVARLVHTSDGSTPRSVAVIVPDDSDWLEAISRRFAEGDAIGEQHREAVSVLAATQAKGMEYDHVLVIEPATIADRGPAGLRQLYVALTRSTQSLTVLHTAPLPEALTAVADDTEPAAPDARPAGVAESLPRIGSDVRVEVVGHVSGGRYKVRPLSPVIDRPLVLTVRQGSVPPRRGAELDCWVFANDTSQTVLTADQRGRSPVSERMAGRYLAALDVLGELIGSDGDVPEARSRLSELQGMANRILRRDQADWVDVLHLFGDPDRERLGVLRDLAATTNRALKEGTFDAGRLAEGLDASGWAGPLAEARRELQERFETKTKPDSGGAVPVVPTQLDQKEEAQMTTADTTVATQAATTKDGFLRALETAAGTDRACKKHEAVRHALKSSLLWTDLQPTDSPIVDVSCLTQHGLFLYEALGAGCSTYADLRSGATRLLEINHTLPAPADGLYLVLSEPPAEDWSVDTIRDVFRVNVIWRSPTGWGGENADTAFGSSGASDHQ
ncbi:ATP-dependent DNA helicase [Streptomyces sp. WAC00288]|uniref:ATP-binding domain-containing protein n=1 Tax=unclassified Streptomyces TaxID=2593676 RepID=UPI000788F4CB|nr:MULTISPECIES: ATP-binding domain-containing protein [unclassified Streptomyces]AVH96988.1 ATP-dependent DNA helicase [Streptomyces sp. WAC00288]KYG55597.1 ATP-dependent DNA helicase [Streptomyces sp. WAC04657]